MNQAPMGLESLNQAPMLPVMESMNQAPQMPMMESMPMGMETMNQAPNFSPMQNAGMLSNSFGGAGELWNDYNDPGGIMRQWLAQQGTAGMRPTR